MNNLRREERMSAEIEEVLLDAEVFERQHLRPDSGETDFLRCSWRRISARQLLFRLLD